MAHTLISIWLLHLAAVASPGANVLLVSQLAAGGQRGSARFAGLGVVLGGGLWAGSAILGVHALFQLFPFLRLGIQVMGGAYLLYLAVRLWQSKPATRLDGTLAASPRAAFRLGMLTSLTNPKAAFFYGSVFAASFPAQPSAALQVAAVAVVLVNGFCWYMTLAYLFSRRRVRTAYARTERGANRVASLCIGGLGVGLLVSTVRAAR